jgi:hypothetical protein
MRTSQASNFLLLWRARRWLDPAPSVVGKFRRHFQAIIWRHMSYGCFVQKALTAAKSQKIAQVLVSPVFYDHR